MRKNHISVLLLLLFLFSGCNALKDSTLSEFYHNVTSRYNIYFNGNELLKEIILDTEEDHVDNYNGILSVLRLGTETSLKNNSSSSDEILKKCNKIFDKHKKSKWIDETYLLAGKAYFCKGDFFAGIEIFQYVISKYKNSKNAFEANIWLVYSYLLLNKVDQAQAMITQLKTNNEFPPSLQKDLLLADAHIDILNEDYISAIKSLEKAIPKETKRDHKTRYQFILGQLYQATDNFAKANEMYQMVIKRNPPYEMNFNAQIEMVHCVQITDEKSARGLQDMLNKMLKDDKNLSYLDQIYFELALIDLKLGNTKDAEKNLKLCIDNSKSNSNQKAIAYLKLAEYYYENSNYSKSKAYYDSTEMSLTSSFPGYKEIVAKNKIISDLVKHYVTIETQDSLLWMVEHPKSADSIIQKVYEAEQAKKAAEEQKAREKKLIEQQEMSMSREQVKTNRMMTPGMPGGRGSGEWYFYNDDMKQIGKSEFKVKWGNRQLVDNWRRKSALSGMGAEEIETDSTSDDEEEFIAPVVLNDTLKKVREEKIKGKASHLQKYYEDFPFTKPEQEVAHAKIMLALKKIGEISVEELYDTTNAIWAYNELVKRYPEGKYKALSHYYLYKYYDENEFPDEKQANKDTILQKFPETDYAVLIKNPNYFSNQVKNQSSAIEALYDDAYAYFNTGDCDQLKTVVDNAKKTYPGNYKQLQFEYLYIICKGKKMPKDEFAKDLSTFVAKSTNEDINAHAQNLIDYLTYVEVESKDGNEITKKGKEEVVEDSLLKKSPFIFRDTGTFYFIYVFETKKVNSNQLKEAFSDYNAKFFSNDELNSSTYVYDKDLQILLVKEFETKFKSIKYLKGLKSDNEFLTTIKNRKPDFYVITKENFSLLIKETNLEVYKKFYEKYY